MFHAFSTALLVRSLTVDVMGTMVVLQSFPWAYIVHAEIIRHEVLEGVSNCWIGFSTGTWG